MVKRKSFFGRKLVIDNSKNYIAQSALSTKRFLLSDYNQYFSLRCKKVMTFSVK